MDSAVAQQEKLDHVRNLILWAILCLTLAIALVVVIFTVGGLFAAAALVALVVAYFLPEIEKAIREYATSRGPSDKCIVRTLGVDTFAAAIVALGCVSFALAGAMQITALAFLSSIILAWLGVALQVAVNDLVVAGIATCTTVIGILSGLLPLIYGYKRCMDKQSNGHVVV